LLLDINITDYHRLALFMDYFVAMEQSALNLINTGQWRIEKFEDNFW